LYGRTWPPQAAATSLAENDGGFEPDPADPPK
jgi:hypothetical protein